MQVVGGCRGTPAPGSCCLSSPPVPAWEVLGAIPAAVGKGDAPAWGHPKAVRARVVALGSPAASQAPYHGRQQLSGAGSSLQTLHVQLWAPARPIPSMIPVPILAMLPQGAGTPRWGCWPRCSPVPSSPSAARTDAPFPAHRAHVARPATLWSGVSSQSPQCFRDWWCGTETGPWPGVPGANCCDSSPTSCRCGPSPCQPWAMEGLQGRRMWDTVCLLW